MLILVVLIPAMLTENTLLSVFENAGQRSLLSRPTGTFLGVRFLGPGNQSEKYSYANLVSRAQIRARLLSDSLVPRQARVALLLPTSVAFYDWFFGVLYAGAIPAALPPPPPLSNLKHYSIRVREMLETINCRHLVISDSYWTRLHSLPCFEGLTLIPATSSGATPTSNPAPTSGAVTSSDAAPASRASPWSLEMSWEVREPTNHHESTVSSTRPDDLAFIQFSSGTTSRPKGIRLTHRQVLANVHQILGCILDAYPESEGTRHSCVSWLPLHHDMGLVGTVLTSLTHATTLTLMSPQRFIMNPCSWLSAISRYRATVSAAPNFAFNRCVEHIERESPKTVGDLDLSCWKVALNGAEAVTSSVMKRFERRFRSYGFHPNTFTPVYGLAEAALLVSNSPLRTPPRLVRFTTSALASGFAVRCHPDAHNAKGAEKTENSHTESAKDVDSHDAQAPQGQTLVSLGRPARGTSVVVRDDRGTELPEDRIGRLWIKGPSLMDGYEGSATPFDADGWLNTGDLCFLHQGELFFIGRSDSILVIRGQNYSAEYIESLVEQLDELGPQRCVAVALPAQELPPQELPPQELSAEELPPVNDDSDRLALMIERPSTIKRSFFPELERLVQRQLSSTGLQAYFVHITRRGKIPRTTSGKPKRSEVKKLLVTEAAKRAAETRPTQSRAHSPAFAPVCPIEGTQS